jgi:hypothetical protein
MTKDRKTRDTGTVGKSVKFEHGVAARLIGIDGTWRRECTVLEVSDECATLTVLSPITGLQLTEFFLSFSSIGLAFRRCELAWVNGEHLGVSFLNHGRRPKGTLQSDKTGDASAYKRDPRK